MTLYHTVPCVLFRNFFVLSFNQAWMELVFQLSGLCKWHKVTATFFTACIQTTGNYISLMWIYLVGKEKLITHFIPHVIHIRLLTLPEPISWSFYSLTNFCLFTLLLLSCFWTMNPLGLSCFAVGEMTHCYTAEFHIAIWQYATGLLSQLHLPSSMWLMEQTAKSTVSRAAKTGLCSSLGPNRLFNTS